MKKSTSKNMILSFLVFLVHWGMAQQNNPEGSQSLVTGVLSSQVGYNIGEPMHINIRVAGSHPDYLSDDTVFKLYNLVTGDVTIEGKVQEWGEKWESNWWIADFSGLEKPGQYQMHIEDGSKKMLSDTIDVGNSILWNKTYKTIAYDFLKLRSEEAFTGKGWKDSGSDLQEFSSHAVAIDGILDVIEATSETMSPEDKKWLLSQALRGTIYLAHLQDKAQELGLGNGSVVHESRDKDVVTGNVAKAAMIFARSSRFLKEEFPKESKDFLKRARRAFAWIEKNGPIINKETQDFYPHIHSAPMGSVPPADQWMTRDLLMMARASVELYKAGKVGYKDKAVHYANLVMGRQVPQIFAEDGLSGHFYTYGNYTHFGGSKFTEKANIHAGAWSKEGRIYNKGGHYPHYLLPLIEMSKLWTSHPAAKQWKTCIHKFAYGYFLPAIRKSPFLILPAGYYPNEGLLYFSSWYHAHNNMYSYTASMALEYEQFFGDSQFHEVAVNNLQWIAGLNVGLKEETPERYLSVSMISGVGSRYRGSWSKIPGSICNGFSASQQFRIAPASAEKDLPLFFDDEGYIAHSLPYLAALARLEQYRKERGE